VGARCFARSCTSAMAGVIYLADSMFEIFCDHVVVAHVDYKIRKSGALVVLSNKTFKALRVSPSQGAF